jgi:hypothetical protein
MCIRPGRWNFILLAPALLLVVTASSLLSSLVGFHVAAFLPLERHNPFSCASPSAYFCYQQPLLDSGSFCGGCTNVLASAWWATLKPDPARLSTTSRDPFRCTAVTATPTRWYIAVALPTWRWTQSCPGAPQGPSHSTRRFRFTAASQACRTSSPKMNLLVILATKTQVFGGTHPIVCHESFLWDGEYLRWCRLQGTLHGWLSLGQPCYNVLSGNSHYYSCVNSNQLLFPLFVRLDLGCHGHLHHTIWAHNEGAWVLYLSFPSSFLLPGPVLLVDHSVQWNVPGGISVGSSYDGRCPHTVELQN